MLLGIIFLLSAIKIVRSELDACSEKRVWFVGNTKYVPIWRKGEIYIYTHCEEGGYPGNELIRCIDGLSEKPLPRCKEGKGESRACSYKRRWSVGNTVYIPVLYYGERYIFTSCKEEGYVVTGKKIIRCIDGLSEHPLSSCEKEISGSSTQMVHHPTKQPGKQKRPWGTNWASHPVACDKNNGGCNHLCDIEGGVPKCRCYDDHNFKMDADGKTCRWWFQYPSAHKGQVTHGKGWMHGGGPPAAKPCATPNCDCDHICKKKKENCTVKCFCRSGYRLMKDGKRCEDIDECSKKSLNRCEQSCHNKKGHYNCSCSEGYILVNDFECQDTDECSEKSLNRCEQNCHNTKGDYTCSCNAGYKLVNDFECQDIDECSEESLNRCEQNCHNTKGDYTCSCNAGYKLVNDFECQDIDECTEQSLNRCEQNCHNTKGDYTCSCSEGYLLVNDSECQDFDECSEQNLNRCEQNCHNTKGDYTCSCNAGYVIVNDFECQDIDECSDQSLNHCEQNCHNTKGNFTCSCNAGYKLVNDFQCHDVDECSDKYLNRCEQNCHNTKGDYTCSCNAGYILVNDFECQACPHNSYRSSVDVSCVECPPNSSTKSEAQTSLKDCHCHSGFAGEPVKGISCDDIDECSDKKLNRCEHFCHNAKGSYTCSCKAGYKLLDGSKCQNKCSVGEVWSIELQKCEQEGIFDLNNIRPQ